jgi:pseudoazurin
MKLRLLALLMVVAANFAVAAEHTVEMKNKGEGGIMVFEPAVLHVAVGDTVTFAPTDAGHNSETVDGLMPEGATPWKGENGQSITVTIDKQGVYVYKCLPHSIMAMVGVIVAGEPVNLEQIKTDAEPFIATFAMKKKRLTKYLAEVK